MLTCAPQPKSGAQPRSRTTRTAGVSPPEMGAATWHATAVESRSRATARASLVPIEAFAFYADTYTREEVDGLLDECNCGASPACATAR
jgi:hypothetical protein